MWTTQVQVSVGEIKIGWQTATQLTWWAAPAVVWEIVISILECYHHR